ncbi:uncharacterized protein LOC127252605 [Andrographis paniculata]|uniref:uncharacterized protein LOC127252605 n=1 Tax=Andrographis paniculata TaxID=175694 RepID=UPI0021E99705|nr:uncharacterized protein LOC127252605 [Andrographis paniculata]
MRVAFVFLYFTKFPILSLSIIYGESSGCEAVIVMDLQSTTVCCLCGDVGFSDQLFRCSNCRSRFQHSYCSSYCGEQSRRVEVCDWCLSEKASSSSGRITSKFPQASSEMRSAYSGEKIKQNNRGDGGATADKVAGKSLSPRPTARRYKLLKDVMC